MIRSWYLVELLNPYMSANLAAEELVRTLIGSAPAEHESFQRSVRKLANHTISHGALSTSSKALVLVALAASPTQIDMDELREVIRFARAAGLSDQQICKAVQLASVAGFHSVSTGIPILVDILVSRDSWSDFERTPEDQEIIGKFENQGPRPRPLDSMFEALLRTDRDFFSVLTEYLDAPWHDEVLDPRDCELIYIAIDVACTHLYTDGIRRHVSAALDLGVSAAEIAHVMQLASLTGLRSLRALADAL